jgi:hypothetical protein
VVGVDVVILGGERGRKEVIKRIEKRKRRDERI